MQKVGRFCFFCLHKLWLSLAITLVLLAALVSILRYSLPYADNYKDQIESFLAQQYGTEVRIGALSAEWRARGPALLLQDLEFSSEAQQLGFSVEQANVHIHFWRSLSRMQLRSSHVELSGVDFRLDAERLTRLPAADQQQEPLLHAVEQLFFHQLQQFSITNSQLQLNQQHGQQLVVDIKRLDWRNQGNRHQGQGQLSVQGITGNSLSFVLDLYGEHLKTTFGQLYLQSEALDVQPWLSQFLPELVELEHASVNLQAWGRVEQGTLQRIQVDLADNTLAWQQNNEAELLQLQGGQLLWFPTTEGWSLYSSDLILQNNATSFPAMTMQLHRQKDAITGVLRQFELASLQQILALVAEQRPQLQALTQAKLVGVLPEVSWSIDAEQWQLQSEIKGFGSTPFADAPGIADLHGHLVATDGFAELRLDGQDNILRWAGAFSSDTQYQQLQARIRLLRQQDIWQLAVPKLSVQGPDIQADAEMLLRFTEQPELFLLATANGVAVPNAMHFYPRHYMPETIIDYLSASLQGGLIKQAATLWHGPLADFPYRQNEGVFQSMGQVVDGQMEFAPGWPQLGNVVAELWFENSQMHISSSQAQLLDLSITDEVVVRIDDLFVANTLQIDIGTEAEASDVTALMMQSPLSPSVGKALHHIGVQGPLAGQVNLQIGLQSGAVLASGLVQFADAKAHLQAPDMDVDHIYGELRFENDQIDATDIDAKWRGLPFKLVLEGQQTDSQYQVNLQLTGQEAMHSLVQQLPFRLDDVADGDADWQLAVSVQLPDDGFRYQAQLQADLTAAVLHLPEPYSKSDGQASALEVWLEGDTERSIIRAAYSEPLYFQARLDHQTNQIDQALLRLGGRNYGALAPGFAVEIDLEQTSLWPWLDLLIEPLSGLTGEQGGQWPGLSYVRGRVAELALYPELNLHQTVFELLPADDHWSLQLNGAEVASQWRFAHDWQQQGIEVDFDYLRLKPKAGVKTEQVPAEVERQAMNWLLQLPPIQLRCQDCTYGPYALGQVTANAANTEQGWQLQNFQADYKRNRLQLNGSWQPDEQVGTTTLEGKLTSANLGALLNEYELSSAISGSRADIDFTLSWLGSPMQFELASLGGRAGWQLGEGSLAEVSDKGARIFSLFSLNSLVRKLRLDFRDVFAKGFFYNRMQGEITLHQGVAQTNNSTIDGVAGNITMQGYTDLVSREMDYQLTLVPKVTSSLPVIIAWMVNPVSGLAALALDEMFTSAEVISRVNFTVTGTFDDPVVTEVNRHSTEVPVPVEIAQPKDEPDSEYNEPPHG